MKISVITPNFNGERFLERAIRSVQGQAEVGTEVEHILIDGGSRDGSMEIARRYAASLARVVSEPDRGPASAINKGLRMASGDVLAWLNADDFYYPGALGRVAAAMDAHRDKALCFGRCRIVAEDGREIRGAITRFKELFFPFSCQFVIQCINYVSQPAMFFRRRAFEAAGALREDMRAAWDYEWILRLWRQGGGVRVPGAPLAAFCWHEASISGRHFREQFREEWEAAAADAGRFTPQALLHGGVRAGIVGIYGLMARARSRRQCR